MYVSSSNTFKIADVSLSEIFLFVKLTTLSKIVSESLNDPSDFFAIIFRASSSKVTSSLLHISLRFSKISFSLILLKSYI